MAKVVDNIITQGLAGEVGDGLLFKTRKGKTFTSKVPDMSNITPSESQTKERSGFAAAVEYAKSIIADPDKKAAYKVKGGKSVYNTAIKDFRNQSAKTPATKIQKKHFTEKQLIAMDLLPQQMVAILFLQDNNKLSNTVYQQLNKVSKATATRHLQNLVARELIQPSGQKGAGAAYSLMGS